MRAFEVGVPPQLVGIGCCSAERRCIEVRLRLLLLECVAVRVVPVLQRDRLLPAVGAARRLWIADGNRASIVDAGGNRSDVVVVVVTRCVW